MTATTVPQDLGTRSWNGLLKAAAVVALLVVLVAGSFAIGRSTADETATIVRRRPSVHAQRVARHAARAPAHRRGTVYVEPDPASCGHTANTPPC